MPLQCSMSEVHPTPAEQIERLEAQIDDLREAIRRSRRLVVAGRACAFAGGALLIWLVLGLATVTPGRLIFGITAGLGGLVLMGSSVGSTRQLEVSLKQTEDEWNAAIDTLEFVDLDDGARLIRPGVWPSPSLKPTVAFDLGRTRAVRLLSNSPGLPCREAVDRKRLRDILLPFQVQETAVAQLLGGIGNAFSDRNFRIYSVGAITSWITYFVQNITFSWLAWDATHSTTWLAIVSAATTVTTILLLPLGGVLADRHDRFRVLMGAYALDWVKSAILAGLALTGQLSLPLICISAVAHGFIRTQPPSLLCSSWPTQFWLRRPARRLPAP